MTWISPIIFDSLFVGIYKLTRYKNLGTPLYSSSSKDKKFSFIVEPGMYAISAQTSTHKSCTEPILIPDIHERLEIIFKLYPKEGLEKSRIEVKGFELYNEFVNLSNEINNFDNKFEDIIDQIENANQVTLENVYKSQYDKLIEIENKFDPFFKQIFIEKHLRLLKDIHPVYYEARGKVKYNIDRNELFKDKRYEDYIKLNLALFSASG